MNKLVFALVGGICSGKTTFADKLVTLGDFVIISKDRCIYESDMLCRVDKIKSWETIREEKINNLLGENVILDETIRVGKLDKLKAKGYTIVAVIMESDNSIRTNRLNKRNELSKQYMSRLSKITGINLLECTQEERRNLWRSKFFIDSLPLDKKQEFDYILEKLYLLGSKILKDEEPNPLCFKQIDYIVSEKDLNLSREMINDDVFAQCFSYEEYKKKWAKNIKYCIWGV